MDIQLIIFYGIGIAATLGVGSGVYWRSAKSKKLIPNFMFIALIGASAYLFFAQYFKYQSLNMYTDFAHWLQILWNIATTGLPISMGAEFQIAGTANYLSAHFVPLVYLFALPFKILPRPEVLPVFNVALMLSSAIPLYKLAHSMYSKFHNPTHPPRNLRGGEGVGYHLFGLFVAALLLWYPTFQYITLYEFEMLRFSIPILLWMLYFFETRRTWLYLLFMILVILMREEMGLTVAMFGIYVFFVARRRKEGLTAVILGLGGFWLITSVIMPAFRAGEYVHVAAGAFFQFGSTPSEILKGVATHPILAAQAAFNPVKLANLFMLGLPLAFVPVVAPSALLGSLASIGTGLLSDSFAHSSYMLYYISPGIPFIFYAFLKAWPKLIYVIASPEGAWRSPGMRLLRFARSDNPEYALMNALLTTVLVSSIFFGPSPLSLQFWFKNIRPAPFRTQDFHWSVYRVNGHHRKASEFVRRIPEDAIVSTQEFLMPRLYRKRGVMKFPQLETKNGQYRAEYALIDRTNNGLNPDSPAYISEEAIDRVAHNKDDWQFIVAQDGYELYKRL